MIFVDADSCANKAKTFILETAIKKNENVTFVANKNIPFSIQSSLFTMKICEQTKDAADNYIVQNATSCDIVITRDLILAERLLKNKVTVINDKGTAFSYENINSLLEERELSLQMKQLGISTGGKWNSYGQNELRKFKETLLKALEN